MSVKTLMIQGTASDVGKSLISTALCRILAREGKKVVPFKSWNMSLNSFVTPLGGEIGIAQALQARAAEVIPEVDMQPILVKPRGDGKSQVIVRGKPMTEIDYKHKDEKYLKKVKKIISESLNNLEKNHEVIVMEGAGSPAEINRKKKDVANMFLAKIKSTPVFLVADIDRGGALAALVGTLKLLPSDENKLVKGLIINRFRGDPKLLDSGIEYLEEKTGKPVLGVIPYSKNIKLPEEDAASLGKNKTKKTKKDLKIAVIRLPRISNFTDFKSLSLESDVNLVYVDHPWELKNTDLIIIPGTKSTTADLSFLKKRGFTTKIKELYQQGRAVAGICGGYQMLGEKLYDEYQTEGEIGTITGLGLLPLETSFLPEKTTHQIKAKINCQHGLFSNMKKQQTILSYEIHMGQSRYLTERKPLFTIFERSGKKVDIKEGMITENGRCFGTYLHGVFNNDSFRRPLLNQLRKNKGLAPLARSSLTYNQELENNLDQIADLVADNLNLDLIYSIIDQQGEI